MRRASEPTDAGSTSALRSARSVTFNQTPRGSSEVPRSSNRYRHPSDSGRDDPSSLLKDFDSKLQSIQDVLNRYQSEKSTQARGGVLGSSGSGLSVSGNNAGGGAGGSSGSDHHHGHHGYHDRPASGSSSAPGSARRWQQQHHHHQKLQQQQPLDPGAIMDEEVFVRHVLATPRRVKSAVPGVPRALSARIEYYRSHRDKAQEKAEKARGEQLAAQREAMANGTAPGTSPINFIEANRRSIVPYALPPSIQMTIDSIRDQGLTSLAACTTRRSRHGTASCTSSGTGAVPEINRSSRPWSGMSNTTLSSARGAAAGPYSLTVSPVSTPAAHATRGLAMAATGAGGGGGGTFAGLSRPGTATSVSSSQYGTYSYGVSGGALMRASTNSAGAGGAPGPGVEAGSVYSGGGTGTSVDGRRLRLALTARPASGGSPTRRVEFIAEQSGRRVERALYAAEVRERAVALDVERRRNIVAASEQRAALRREEEARLAAARALAERQERQRQWTGIVGLCSKISFVAERIMEDRRIRALRALRKAAAMKIASWYKGILLRRRQVELVSLIRRLKGLLKPYLAVQRELVRQRCTARIVSFLQYTQTSNMAVVGVRRLKAEVEVLQTAWRNALLVRNTQRQILYNQLTRLERDIVCTNKRIERTYAGQMFRLGKSVNILEPDGAVPPSAAAAAGGGGGGGIAGRSFKSLGASSARSHGPPQQQQQQAGGTLTISDAMSVVPAATDAGAGTSARGKYDRMRQPYRGVLVHEGLLEEEDEVLRSHLEMVPREVREQVVNAFLLEARREHRKLLEQYSNEKMLYLARRPIEELRQKMLRDAGGGAGGGGLTMEPDVKPPVMPHMRLVYPRPKLKELLRRAVEINQARLAAAEERRQQEAAEVAAGGGRSTHWLAEHRHGGGGGGGGGVLWADLHGGGGGGGGAHGGGGGAGLSRANTVRRTFSRTSHRGTSHRSLKVPPPPPPPTTQ
ncbi:hypothetical protein VOLCADRAFT_96202 [Volvox carteri f. nagariensis]|uniref:Uncharacterized protein n=1 Tax=Volvox carteri f. nagariensis TaxID=3068 RepID=D8U9H5_VOLCA|nr:uncharacterized protein VOLCADRAFT_96202 [Volvox carteri f. nagariensis]EFJ43584.1 hypothetical protein VOLCADRAFT_96202 [Volvox carteri f. nagariensis]|eukprot:XP_002955284.1 hypothetical protein VOLCADRAFT_96202 [Volvox carteri f. nagariensis]